MTACLKAANDGCSILYPDQKLRVMAEAYLSVAQTSPDYFRLLSAFDRGAFQGDISPEHRTQIFEMSNLTLAPAAHPIRREMMHVNAPGRYRATLEACLRGLGCP